MAVAFPRFHDIYKEAKVHESWGRIDDDAGKTFEATLERRSVPGCRWSRSAPGTTGAKGP